MTYTWLQKSPGFKQVRSWFSTCFRPACDTLTHVCDQVIDQVCSWLESWNAALRDAFAIMRYTNPRLLYLLHCESAITPLRSADLSLSRSHRQTAHVWHSGNALASFQAVISDIAEWVTSALQDNNAACVELDCSASILWSGQKLDVYLSEALSVLFLWQAELIFYSFFR